MDYALIYFLWLLLPPLVIGALIIRRAHKLLFTSVSFLLILISLPVYLSLPLYLAGWAWPPDIVLPTETRQSVDLADYRVDYVQSWGGDFYHTRFEVVRGDGKQAVVEIDADANKCWNLTVQRVGAKGYFLCDESVISNRTSYVDLDQLILYSGWTESVESIEALHFE